MPIVGGLDIHRKQITFDYLDTVTGQVCRGQIAPADRAHLRAWPGPLPAGRSAGGPVSGVRGGPVPAEHAAHWRPSSPSPAFRRGGIPGLLLAASLEWAGEAAFW